MKRTFLDKVILVIIILLIVLFIILAIYTTHATQQVVIKEKQDSLINEATLLAEQTILSYEQGITSLEYLQVRFDEFEDTMKTNLWYFSVDGDLIVASNAGNHSRIPKNIYNLDENIDLEKGFTQTGMFYDVFDGTMVSIGIPISMRDKMVGYLVLHTSLSELDNLQDDMLNIMYMPFLVIILVVGIVLAYLSGTVLRPIAKISNTAKEYAKGNFEARTGVKRQDELGELSDSMEYMASELNKLDEYRKNFIANISHDFRSPLTSIKGYLEAMLDGTIPIEKYDRYLNIVLNEAKRLTKLTTGLLELNDFDTYGPILKRQTFDIVDVIRETRNTVEGLCEEKRIDFRLNCPAEDTIVYADKMKMGQVVYNLIDNALKFSPEGGTITVTVYDKNGKLFVSVKDEGPGIEKDSQNKIWDRFYKTDKSRGKDKQGNGLGLAITREIIKAHGETINLISTEGAGCEFVFTLGREAGQE
ncbi:MAG: HAMP domain-containing histidine kinase [Bacteroidales bacterium]|nr:HAMP domain-containing histidine kinase [Clostridium sp.]MCM1203576.1 HAMP domain-containing histidine kinase [Bacteroidales bacterium]